MLHREGNGERVAFPTVANRCPGSTVAGLQKVSIKPCGMDFFKATTPILSAKELPVLG
jgi:hypothetical protein